MSTRTFKQMAEAAEAKYMEGVKIPVGKAIAMATEFKKYFSPDYEGPRVPFTELMTANDFGILLQRIINDQLQMPVEPEYLGVSLFSRTLNVAGATTVRVPIMGAVNAADVPVGQPVPRQDASFTQQMITMDANRSGVAFALDKEVLNDSMYNIMGLLVEAGRRALLRHKEKKVWDAVLAGAHVAYTNTGSDSRGWTNGKGDTGSGLARNGSIAFDDFIEMMGQLMVNGHTPTDMILNPMAWAILHKDPIMRAQFLTQGQVGAAIWNKRPEMNNQALTPWGIMYHSSRFMPVEFEQTYTICGTTGTSGNFTDILMFDRNNPVLIIEREGLQTDQWDSKETDVHTLVMKERYSIYAVDAMRAAIKAEKVRLVPNEQTVFNVGTVVI
jgi:hypothetical protein